MATRRYVVTNVVLPELGSTKCEEASPGSVKHLTTVYKAEAEENTWMPKNDKSFSVENIIGNVPPPTETNEEDEKCHKKMSQATKIGAIGSIRSGTLG